MQIAAFSLAEVTYAAGGDISFQVQESVKNARFRIRTKQENVSGVFLPAFESFTKDDINDFQLTGLGMLHGFGVMGVNGARQGWTTGQEV